MLNRNNNNSNEKIAKKFTLNKNQFNSFRDWKQRLQACNEAANLLSIVASRGHYEGVSSGQGQSTTTTKLCKGCSVAATLWTSASIHSGSESSPEWTGASLQGVSVQLQRTEAIPT